MPAVVLSRYRLPGTPGMWIDHVTVSELPDGSGGPALDGPSGLVRS